MFIRSFATTIFSALFVVAMTAQNRLETTFYDYHVISIDSKSETRGTSDGFFETTISVPGTDMDWELDMRVANIIGDNYMVRYTDGSSIVERRGTSVVPTTGYVKGFPESRASLTFADGFVYGFVQKQGKYYYIEPLSHYSDNTDYDKYVVYSEDDLRPTAEKTCATDMHKHGIHDVGNDVKADQSRLGECYDVEYAIANDFLMFQDYGSVGAVEAHAIGVTNNIQTNYDDEFADELTFVIVEQFVATSSASDPWTSSNNAGTLLDDFTDWGPSGFINNHDIGSIWTARNFSGGTIGVAWVGTVCTGLRYNALEDFSNNANLKRVMVAHEIGHNFSAGHDGSGGFIMSPSVNNTTTWSSGSVSSINNHIASRWCLSDCAGGGSGTAPVASFTFEQFEDCAPAEVQYTDESTGSNLSFLWSFPGGSPSSSTSQNPVVTYFGAGTYSASLTVSNNNGVSTDEQTGIISVSEPPAPDFNFDIFENNVSFFNNTFEGDSYLWEFGDGQTSTAVDPIHTYLDDGFYQVTLTAFNQCGQMEFTTQIEIATLPVADFDFSNPQGCAPHIVQFTNTSSSNSDSFFWEFPGGNPASSSATNPEVEYTVAGTYDVSLTVTNEQGIESTTESGIIVISASPTASFTFTVDGPTVTFTNTSQGGDSFVWNFGDGSSSMEESPIHTYAAQGEYTVTLEVIGDCTPSTFVDEVSISLLPNAAFSTVSGATAGCAPFEVNFVDQSTNDPTSYQWTFEGGTPATSTDAEPVVTYATAGTYDVRLVVQNANGSDEVVVADYIQVQASPTADPTSDAAELSVSFEANATNSQGVTWDFGDGTMSTELNPSHVYGEDGEYTVTLTVSGVCGDVTETITVLAYSQVTAGFTSGATTLCAGSTVTYTSMSSSNVTDYMWEFEGGTPATSNAANPTVTYAEAGTYQVSLQVANVLYEDEAVIDDYVTIQGNLTPVAAANADALTVTYTNTGDAGDSYLWDFGDGTTSTEANPTHTYQEEDIYTALLTVTNTCGSFTSEVVVNLFSQVTAGIMSGIAGGCAPYTISFMDATSDNTTEWLWTFEGGEPATSTMAAPSVTYSEAGTYTVTLQASNPASTATASIIVEVTDVVEVDFNYFREQLEISFTNTSVGEGDSYLWDFGDGATSTDENPTHTYATEGEYEVTLEVTNECGTSTYTETVLANSLPSAGFEVAGDSEGCLPFTVQFEDASSSNATAWLWTFEGGTPATSTDENPTVVYDEVGSYGVTLQVTAAAGTDEIEITDVIEVSDIPEATFSTAVTDLTVEMTYQGDNYESIMWDFGNGTTSSEENPTFTYNTPGTYTITMTVSNPCGDRVVMQEVVVMSTSVSDIDALEFTMYPNPVRELLTVETTARDAKLTILDITGQLVLVQSTTGHTTLVNTGDLAQGTYVLQLQDKSGHTAHRKLVVFR